MVNSNVHFFAGIPIKEVPFLKSEDYMPAHHTALYDAIAEGVRLADEDKDFDERVICVIMTDGQENASRMTTGGQVRAMINDREVQGDWTFVYIGADPAKWSRYTATPLGNCSPFTNDNGLVNYDLLNSAVANLRMSPFHQTENVFELNYPSPSYSSCSDI